MDDAIPTQLIGHTDAKRGLFARLAATFNSPLGIAGLAWLVYFVSSFFSASFPRYGSDPHPGELALRYGSQRYVMMSLPRIVRGDEMHYLMLAYSLAQDGDLRISDDYASVSQGGFEMGYWHRGERVYNMFQHFSRAPNGTLLNNHPFGFSLLLALLLWPLAHTPYMEAGSIWVTTLVAAAGLRLFIAILLGAGFRWKHVRTSALILAFASPYWSYARTLYTEPYVSGGYLVLIYFLLRAQALRILPLLAGLVWFKYPVFLMFLSGGIAELTARRVRNFLIFGVTGAALLLAAGQFNAWFYKGRGWTSTESERSRPQSPIGLAGRTVTMNAPISFVSGSLVSNVGGVLFESDKGLLPYTPVLLAAALGLGLCWTANRRLCVVTVLCAAPWALLHFCYEYVLAGESYTARYFVPILPLVFLGLPALLERMNRRSAKAVFWALSAYSFVINAIAGVFPATAFGKSPLEMLEAAGKIGKAAIHALI